MKITRVAVLGAGSWGATLADLLGRKGLDVRLWDAHAEPLERLREERHPFGIPELRLSEGVRLCDDIEAAMRGSDAALLACPAQALDSLAARIAALPGSSHPASLVVVAKGIEVSTGRLPAEVLSAHLPLPLAVLSGPCIAREVAKGVPTSAVAASAHGKLATAVQEACMTARFRIYTHDDVVGVELGGALKNVVAIAAGATDGLGFGDNTKAALVCRGLAEMTRLAGALGAQQRTLAGLAGLGDLTVTCFSPHSRNRTFGECLAKGESAAAIVDRLGQVVEGVPTARAAVELAMKHGVEVPIMSAVHHLCTGRLTAVQALDQLMNRDPKPEFA
ncbi:MAG: NAD(P)H-dependent glycerol-3-phosphate dehydrogenase [Candidatus Sumerlaeia bacterium]|nr:NAD(P)H-dependent glycerol-3-phosphate dehydrogenase [Candidatus Sumerlaeia bacterium]